ncbi:hypothetical protein [Fluviicola taffensis]|uniref:hypothetical protein n=1 Tax=Fluviicola taffensis TaxID=191579 RepID=UPI003137E9D3
MTGSTTLDVVLGLVFVYLLYSLLTTILQEALANVLSFRAKFLQKAIIRMLEDENAKTADTLLNRIGAFFRVIFRKNVTSQSLPLTEAFYNHPLIKYLAEDDYKNKPSYLTSRNFSQAMLDLLKGNDFAAGDDPGKFIKTALESGVTQWKSNGKPVQINAETLSYLRALWADAQGDVAKFRTALEEWFDVTMERTTGWYKKHTQGVLLILGFLIAMLFNVDTIKLAGTLSKNPELREQVIRQADNYIKTHKDLLKEGDQKTEASLQRLQKRADSLLKTDIADVNKALGIGWKCTSVKEHENKCFHGKDVCIRSHLRIDTIIGWLITAFALSLGAPFWFDLLNKLMKLRGTINSGKDDGKETNSSKPTPTNIKG